MKLTFTYGSQVVALPALVAEHIEKATKSDIRILLELAADPVSFVDLSLAKERVAARCKRSLGEVDAALAFWRGAGVLALSEEAGPEAAVIAPAEAAEVPAPRVIADKGLPSYSTEELSGILERRRDLGKLIDDAQQAFGKIFNQSEITTIAGMADYLGLDAEYILLLLTHCRNMEKKSLRYVEKLAISLHDEGVHDARILEERLHRIEVMAHATGRVRAMFGMTSRALTSKEKALLEKWVCEMQYDDDVIRLAYEATVDATGKASIPYASKILERWFAEGYKTVEDVERAIAEYKRKKAGGSSFEVDDFFEAALRRTYGA